MAGEIIGLKRKIMISIPEWEDLNKINLPFTTPNTIFCIPTQKIIVVSPQ